MNNIDEKIAKLKMSQRLQKENVEKESLKEEVEIKEQKITLEEVIKQIEQGEVRIQETKLKFEKTSFLNGILEMHIPIGYFEEKGNNSNSISLVNEFYGVSFTANYIPKGAVKQSFAKFKKGMEKGFKEMELYLEWIEEGEIGEGFNKINYGVYKNPTGKGNLYNVIFYRQKKDTVFIGNYNCFFKDIEVWELIIKATMHLIKIN
ncbi:hypothetical protein [uncultured Clostridium sp.]|uniref:hypothetical protein n=1 Tax=uncultured Clostridium sp. TaxID=59620 RepID=UPI0028E5FEA4|nr:hypothetical protein [uncultured Clostridium sp.]